MYDLIHHVLLDVQSQFHLHLIHLQVPHHLQFQLNRKQLKQGMKLLLLHKLLQRLKLNLIRMNFFFLQRWDHQFLNLQCRHQYHHSYHYNHNYHLVLIIHHHHFLCHN
jgi:hypothetical protein